MRILFVAMSDSIHTARWISQIAEKGWDLHLHPSMDVGSIHPQMNNVQAHVPIYGSARRSADLTIRGLPVFSDFVAKGVMTVLRKAESYPAHQVRRLVRTIRRVKPDIIHSLEMQQAGYLTLEARKLMPEKFPPWVVSNWGSDIYLFGRLPDHEQKIREVLAACDYYSCECRRDVCLAKAYGLKGEVLPVFPSAGGFNLEEAGRMRQQGAVSRRRLIMLKGYQHWAGRALVGLRALERCAELLSGYELAIYGASPEVQLAAKLFSRSTGVRTTIVPSNSSHRQILQLHGRARISIGLSISDAISTSMLEALVMGSFPIQSWTACADEWLEDGRSGILVPPEDPEVVEQAIRRALTDDDLVDVAATLNYDLAASRLDEVMLKPMVADIYTTVMRKKGETR